MSKRDHLRAELYGLTNVELIHQFVRKTPLLKTTLIRAILDNMSDGECATELAAMETERDLASTLEKSIERITTT